MYSKVRKNDWPVVKQKVTTYIWQENVSFDQVRIYGWFSIMAVTYCHKFSSLKQNTFIISQLPRSGVLWAWLVSHFKSYKAKIKEFSSGSSERESTSWFIQVVQLGSPFLCRPVGLFLVLVCGSLAKPSSLCHISSASFLSVASLWLFNLPLLLWSAQMISVAE